jgi:hypothetical protein
VTARQVAGVWSRLGWPFESLSTAPGTAPPSRVLAVASVFSGVWLEREPWRDPRQVLVLVAVSVLVWLGAGLVPGRLFVRMPLPLVMPIAMMGYMVAAQFARRSRFLWLSEGSSRADLFRLCERRSLRMLAMSMVGLCAFLLALSPHMLLAGVPPAGIAWLAGLIATSVAGGHYLGLMSIEGWRPLDVTVAVLLFLAPAVGSTAAMDGEASQHITLAAIALQGAIAMTCRKIAARRWERIDWLQLRPVPWGLRWGQILNPRKIHGLTRRAPQVDDAT